MPDVRGVNPFRKTVVEQGSRSGLWTKENIICPKSPPQNCSLMVKTDMGLSYFMAKKREESDEMRSWET